MFCKRLTQTAILPKRQTNLSCGYDLYSDEDTEILAHDRGVVKTGIAVAIPPNHYGQIATRSSYGMAGFFVIAGVIDSDYRGGLCVIIYNSTDVDLIISKGTRIAQLIIIKTFLSDVIETDNLDFTERGENGFGSSGDKPQIRNIEPIDNNFITAPILTNMYDDTKSR